jgi:trans-aconitate 2-methyltransferase
MADSWNAELYKSKHSFVPQHGEDLITLLNPKPGERILDLGCGTGDLTNKISERGALVVGLDSSANMIEAARVAYPNISFVVGDARDFSFEAKFDAVFSNAVLHWILEAEKVVECVSKSLREGGRLVLEMGGKGNVAKIAQAVKESIREIESVEVNDFWFYPSIGEYAFLLERHGFEVQYAAHFERPTKLEDGEDGLRNWITMFCDKFFTQIPQVNRDEIIKRSEMKLRDELFRDGAWRADYKRLRISAICQRRLR